MIILRSKTKAKASTPISEFVRNASAREKKRVYKVVLEKAIEQQRQIEREVARRARVCA